VHLRLDWRRTCAAIAFVWGLCHARPVRAAELAAQLDYDVAAGCPADADFAALVAKRLGYDPFHPSSPEPVEMEVQVIVRIERSGTTLNGRLEWRNANGNWLGEHAFPSRTGNCAEIVRAMTFSLALQMRLMAAAAPEPPPVAPAPTPAAPPEVVEPKTAAPEAPIASPPPTPPAPPPPPPPPAPSTPILGIAAGVTAGVGLAADPVAIGRLLGNLAWSRVGLELAAEISAPSTTHRQDGAGFSQYQLTASVAGCALGRRFSACLLVKAGEIRVTGKELAFPASPSAFFLQGGARLGATQRLGARAYVAIHADGLTALTRETVTIDAIPIWTTPRLAVLLGIDVGLRFQ